MKICAGFQERNPARNLKNLIIIHNSEADEDAAVNLFLFSNPVRCRKIPHLFLSGKETENET